MLANYHNDSTVTQGFAMVPSNVTSNWFTSFDGDGSCDDGSSNCSATQTSDVLILLEITGEVLIAILAIFGNGFVLVAIATATSLQTVTNYYVASLAASDLLVGLLGIPCVITAFNGLPTNFFGCLIVNSCIIVLTQISIFGLLVVALERFYAIKYPYYYYRHCTTKSAIAAITLTWTAGIVVGMVPIFGWNKGKMAAYEDGSTCTFTGVIDMEYMVYMNFFGFVLPPLLAMFSIYGYIYTVVRKQIRKIYALQLRTGAPPVITLNPSHAPVSTISKSVQETETANGTEIQLQELGHSRMNGSEAGTPSSVVDQAEKSDVSSESTSSMTGQSRIAEQTTLSVNGLDSTERMSQVLSQTPLENNSNGILEKRKKTVSIRDLVTTTPKAASSSSDSNSTTETRKSVSSWKKEIRAAKWFAVVLSVFTACWLPLHIMNCVTVFGGPTCLPCVTSAVLLSHLNSAVNPILYAYSNSKFSAAFRRMLRMRSGIPRALNESLCTTDRTQR